MSEAAFRREFNQVIAPLDPVSVENLLTGKTGIGTPDVNHTYGWVELKWLRSYPKRETTPVRIDHYTDEQRSWLLRRYMADGGAWLVLKIRTDWYLFNALQAQKVGFLTKSEMQETADCYFDKKPSSSALCLAFRQSFELMDSWCVDYPEYA